MFANSSPQSIYAYMHHTLTYIHTHICITTCIYTHIYTTMCINIHTDIYINIHYIYKQREKANTANVNVW